MYSAQITKIGEIDSSGLFEVYFDVYKEKELLFENQVRRGVEKGIVVDEIRTYLKEIEQKYIEVQKFEIGEVITL